MNDVRSAAVAVPLTNLLPKNPGASTLLYGTEQGLALVGDSRAILDSQDLAAIKGDVQLVFTSPPFPLNRKKRYGNLTGEAFKDWLVSFAPLFRELLTDDGSIVIEMGNAWVPGKPVMSTLAMETLLEFKRKADLHLCQEFVWYNPAKLPTPAQWVTIERIRVKDAFTRLWWLSPVEKPKATNRNVLLPYGESMRELLETKRYNSGRRPSEHVIGEESFLKDNGGAIPPNVVQVEMQQEGQQEESGTVLVGANTGRNNAYHQYCAENGIRPHPARMPPQLVKFFVDFLTDPGDLVVDPFAGSNTTGFVAESLGREWVALEADADYARSGSARFGEQVRWLAR
jgi:hypothetical protein